MATADTYIDHINRLPIDIRTEVLLANLVENGLGLEDILVVPVGLFRRNYQNDIGKAELAEMPRTGKQKLRLEINRDGLYDALPEGLFHQPTHNKLPDNRKEVLAEIKRQQEREEAARTFFLPLEQEYYRLRVRLVLEERKYLLESDQFWEGDWFSEFWNFPAFLSPAQIHNLLYLLPMVHRIAGDWEQIQYSFEILLEDPVRISQSAPLHYLITGTEGELGEVQLGIDWIMGGEYAEMHSSVQIQVSPAVSQRIALYLPGGQGLQLIQYLSQYLFPLETDYQVEVNLSSEKGDFLMDEEIHNGLLGYTTYL